MFSHVCILKQFQAYRKGVCISFYDMIPHSSKYFTVKILSNVPTCLSFLSGSGSYPGILFSYQISCLLHSGTVLLQSFPIFQALSEEYKAFFILQDDPQSGFICCSSKPDSSHTSVERMYRNDTVHTIPTHHYHLYHLVKLVFLHNEVYFSLSI